MSRKLRDSGVAWLGLVPADWATVPARALFGERKARSAVSDIHLTPSQKYGVLPQEEYMKITGNKVVLNLTGADKMRHVEAGDYVSHLRSFQGGLEFAGIPGKVSAAYTVLKPKVALDSRFFGYLFKSDLYIQALQTTTDQLRDGQSIRYPQFSQIPLPQPSLEEQRVIADYLDREAAQIDAFIAKNEQLIALLAERRAAVIADAVSRGIGTAPELVDAPGLVLGAMPAGWSLMPLKRAVGYQEGPGIMASDFRESGVPLLRISSVNRAVATLEGCNYLDPELVRDRWSHFQVAEGDLLISASASMGTVAEVRAGEVVGGVPYTGIIRITAGRMVREFAKWFFVSEAFLKQVETLKTGSTIQHFGPSHLGQMWVALPSIAEQREIATHLQRATARVDESVRIAKRGVAFAKERRAALISAAITGKIDVREAS